VASSGTTSTASLGEAALSVGRPEMIPTAVNQTRPAHDALYRHSFGVTSATRRRAPGQSVAVDKSRARRAPLAAAIMAAAARQVPPPPLSRWHLTVPSVLRRRTQSPRKQFTVVAAWLHRCQMAETSSTNRL